MAEIPRITVKGVEIHFEGDHPRTVVMLHGWPDTYRLWDTTVAALKDRYCCVRFTLPGFDTAAPATNHLARRHVRVAADPGRPGQSRRAGDPAAA